MINMPYAVTELSPSPTDIKIRRLGSFLELRTPMLVVGEYQGGDRQLADGRIIKQAKIYYSPEVLKILAETALGTNGDVEHSDSKFDVVSVLRETDITDPNILYGRIIVHNQEMISEILAGNFRGISIQAHMETEFNEKTTRFEGTGGRILAYAHTNNPAVSTATIEGMKTIQLSHNIIESFNKDKVENSPNNKTKSELSMTGEDKIVELSAKLAEQSMIIADRDSKITESDTKIAESDVKIETLSTELEQTVATSTEHEAKIVELSTKISEMETKVQLGKKEAQDKELSVLQSEIKKIDEKFDPKVYLHESMNFESQKQILEAILTDKKKLSQNVDLSILPASGGGDIDEDALKQALGGIPFEVALGGQDQSFFW